MKNGNQDWNNDFPIEEEVEDHAGRTRRFLITSHEGPLGFTVRAQEQGAQGTGYEFAAYSETSPHNALGRLRQKMYRGLATRHITRSLHGYRMLHDKLNGRIASDARRRAGGRRWDSSLNRRPRPYPYIARRLEL